MTTLTRKQVDALPQPEFHKLMRHVLSRVERSQQPKTVFLSKIPVGESVVIDRKHYIQTNERDKARIEVGDPDAEWISRRLGNGRLKVTRAR